MIARRSALADLWHGWIRSGAGTRMTVIPDEPETSSPTPAEPGPRLDVRILLAALSLVLVIVPFTLTLFLVEDRWAPLWRADSGARDGLHPYALSHPGFVAGMRLISDSGSAVVWLVVLALLSGWLLWRRMPQVTSGWSLDGTVSR